MLDDKVRRNLRMLIASGGLDGRRPGTINTKAHWDVARRVAQDGIVLLKNEPSVLPLDLAKLKTIAVIGDNAVRRFAAGGNAAGVKAFHETTALDGIVARVGGRADVVFSQGYRQPARRGFGQPDVAGVRTSELTAASPEEAKELADRAVETARRADAVLFVGGLTHQSGADDEGVDRRDLSLPAHQDELIARIVEANPRTAVVLIAGSPVDMTSWLAKTPAVLQAWYGGSEAGPALAAVLFGDVSPSGKLPCTFPKALADSPAHAAGLARQFPGEGGKVWYDEGLFVGYRWNDAKAIEPLFPFGHGLSYTRFQYASLQAALTAAADGPSATLSLQVTNTGEREGAEVVQAYVRPVKPPVTPAREGAEGLREGAAEAGRDEERDPGARPPRLRVLRPRGEGLARREGPLRRARRRQLARHPAHRQRGGGEGRALEVRRAGQARGARRARRGDRRNPPDRVAALRTTCVTHRVGTLRPIPELRYGDMTRPPSDDVAPGTGASCGTVWAMESDEWTSPEGSDDETHPHRRVRRCASLRPAGFGEVTSTDGWRPYATRDEIAPRSWSDRDAQGGLRLGLAGRGDDAVDGRWAREVPVVAGKTYAFGAAYRRRASLPPRAACSRASSGSTPRARRCGRWSTRSSAPRGPTAGRRSRGPTARPRRRRARVSSFTCAGRPRARCCGATRPSRKPRCPRRAASRWPR